MKLTNQHKFESIAETRRIVTAMRRSDFAIRVRAKMVAKDLKNIDISERLGVSEANVSRWLRGNQNLSLDTLHALADAIEEPLLITVGHDGGLVWEEEEDGQMGLPFRARAQVVDLARYRELQALRCNRDEIDFKEPLSEFVTSDDGEPDERATALA